MMLYWDVEVMVKHAQERCDGKITIVTDRAERDRCCVRVGARCDVCGRCEVVSISGDAVESR
jgi:hypothetical protein